MSDQNDILDAQYVLERVIRDNEREKVMRRVLLEAGTAVAEQEFSRWLGLYWLRRAGAKAVLARLERLQR